MQSYAANQTDFGANLSATQERAILALLSQPTLKKAASVVGMDETTLWRWLQEKDFHAAYMSARRETVGRALARIQQSTTDAVATLRSVMKDKQAPASARVAAAKTIIDYAVKAVTYDDLAKRIEELEQVARFKQ
jgi:hypothetical protein